MTDLKPDHPAVEAATPDIHSISLREYTPEDCHETIADALTAALPHLTADDLRNTDAAEEIRTEGWMQGWAAGRDLDGDEDATPYLRNTPAGRALMAEAWEAGVAQFARYGDVDANPYRKEGNA